MKKITINKEQGTVLAAWLSLPPDPQYLLIVCHGFFGAKENRGKIFTFADKLNEKGLGVLAFDFTGCGESSGEFSEITLSRQADDLNTVISFAMQEYKLPLLLLGRSFGGSTIIALPEHPASVKGYIFWSVPIDLKKTFSKVLDSQYYELESGAAITVKENDQQYILQPAFAADIKNIDLKQALITLESKPVLICHGKADEVVEFGNAVKMHEKLPQSTLVLVDDADHSFTDFTELREKITIEWLENTFIK